MTMRLMLSSALSLADAGLVTVVPDVESENATFVERVCEFLAVDPAFNATDAPCEGLIRAGGLVGSENRRLCSVRRDSAGPGDSGEDHDLPAKRQELVA